MLRHRIILNFDAHADGQTPDAILTAIIRGVTAHGFRCVGIRHLPKSPLLDREFLEKLERLTIHWQTVVRRSGGRATTVRASPAAARNFSITAISITATICVR